MHFNGCRTPEDIKARFRQLAKKLHPDAGGTHEQFIALTEQYHAALSGISGQSFTRSDNEGEYTYRYNEEKENEIVDKIDEVLQALHAEIASELIDVWLIGRWLWIRGDTKPIRSKLGRKGIGFKWHGKRAAWYWKPSNEPRSRRSKEGLDAIASRYGASKLTADEERRSQRRTPALTAA